MQTKTLDYAPMLKLKTTMGYLFLEEKIPGIPVLAVLTAREDESCYSIVQSSRTASRQNIPGYSVYDVPEW
jgi:hypothetical protein